jgi:hypothetical protein
MIDTLKEFDLRRMQTAQEVRLVLYETSLVRFARFYTIDASCHSLYDVRRIVGK